jgi:Acetyltransferase (GNAT) family
MRELPDRPDMDQLRRQARALHRAAAACDGDALQRVQAVSLQPTLAAAQLALAREYGYRSWARLKAQVERRRASPHAGYVIRPVASLDELTHAFDFLGTQATPAITHEDRRFSDLARRFPEDRSLMLVVENRHGRIVGGLLACRRGSGVTPRAVAVEPGAQRDELITRLLQTVEIEARRLGADEIVEGGVGDDRSLYERQGYGRRNPMTRRLLPLPGRAREALLGRIADSRGGQGG